MKAAYLRADVERKGDEVIVHMNDITARALADFLAEPKPVIGIHGYATDEIEPPLEWTELAAELRTS